MIRQYKKRMTWLAMMMGVAGCSEAPDSIVEEQNAEIIQNLMLAGFSEDDIDIQMLPAVVEESENHIVFGAPEPQVVVGGDTHVTLEASKELAGQVDTGEDDFRHWRTPSIVTNDKTICLVMMGSLNSKMKTGVTRTRDNYNELDMGLTFKAGDAVSYNCPDIPPGAYLPPNYVGCGVTHAMTGCNDVVWISTISNVDYLGQAGFPSNGKAYNRVYINGELKNDSSIPADGFEHLVTHEIGHAIGLRHSDWKTRNSCDDKYNEGQDSAKHISGTADQTKNSIMAACGSLKSTNGEFRGEDVEALEKLYPD